MGVGPRREHVLGWNARVLMDHLFGRAADFVAHADVVHNNQGKPGESVVQDDALGVQFIVNVRGRHGLPSTDDGEAQGRGDVAGRGPGAKDVFRLGIGFGSGALRRARRQDGSENPESQACNGKW